ncbi:MAG: ABC transporter permease [Sulfitobacter sp.]
MRRPILTPWEMALVVILIGVCIVMSRLTPFFLDLYNLIDSTVNYSEKALIALPMALLIIARQIDVSVASIVALAAVLIGVAASAGAPTPVLVLVGLTVGTLAGAFNGLLVNVLGVHSIVVTIGTLSLYRGIATSIVGDDALTTFPISFFWFGQHYISGYIPVSFVFFVVAAVIVGILLHATTYGRRIFAIGTNPDATRYSGIRVDRYSLVLFAATGFMCGLAAILLSSRLGSVRLNIATGWELEVITMVVLGGVGIAGGSGTIIGVILAVFVIGFLTFGLSLNNVPGIVMNIYVGLMLIGAIALPKLAGTARLLLFHRPKEG